MICGSNELLMSRGTSIATEPISVSTVLTRALLREFPLPTFWQPMRRQSFKPTQP
jgi:hypothetical protein